ENIGAGLAEPVAVGQQHHNRGDTPSHAEHGERGAATVVPHSAVGFVEQITQHRLNPGLKLEAAYSCRRASTGCSRAALRAGYSPAATPASVKQAIARIADAGTSLGGSNPPGPCCLPSSAIRAPASPIPISPLNNVRRIPSRKNWTRMLRLVAPRALRNPISRVRSLTATSM